MTRSNFRRPRARAQTATIASFAPRVLAAAGLSVFTSLAFAQGMPRDAGPIPVSADNFERAESDMYFSGIVKDNGFGRLSHHRELMRIDKQTVVRPNRDTLYSSGVFDLDAGPVTVTLPDAGTRFRSMMAIDEDHYLHGVVYDAGSYTFTREKTGTRYVLIGVRTFVNPASPADLEEAHALQDAIKVEQKSAGSFEVPKWDKTSQKTVRDALARLGTTLGDSRSMFGSRNDVSPVRHLIGTATLWGGNPEKDATYLTYSTAKNDGATVYSLHVKDVPVDGFWSVSVYNADGYFLSNEYGAYTVNNVTAKKSADGAIDIRFGGCDGKTPNCLPITPGWNYTVRLYRPRAEFLRGAWTFPQAQALP
jgi:hypothetical protein